VTHELWVDCQVSGYGHGSDGQGGGWPGLKQVVLIRTTRQRIRDGSIIVEDHYYITSLRPDQRQGRAEALLKLGRKHWEIENCLHHVKDRSMGEDAQRCKRGASIWSRLRSIAVGLFAQIMGDGTPLKQILIAAKPSIALKMLKHRKLFKYAHR